jgi:hypothetical protein
MTGPFGVKETSTKRLAESTKIEADAGELASQVLKTIHNRVQPLKAPAPDLTRLKITIKARDNLDKAVESEKKIRDPSCARISVGVTNSGPALALYSQISASRIRDLR